MDAQSDYASPQLKPTGAPLVAGRPLPLDLVVDNPGGDALRGARGELTIEVEKGVLLSWQFQVAEVPAHGRCESALTSSEPEWRLPINVQPGKAKLRVVLNAADGAYLNEHTLELQVAAS